MLFMAGSTPRGRLLVLRGNIVVAVHKGSSVGMSTSTSGGAAKKCSGNPGAMLGAWERNRDFSAFSESEIVASLFAGLGWDGSQERKRVESW